jgi:ubiquinone/menaquinone biosynthesis C-methylase UbiE
MSLRLSFVLLLCLVQPAFAAWTTREEPGEPSGKHIEVLNDGKPVARFVFGDGQLKPFLHIRGQMGELLTEWKAEQQFPHHRGIYIGWNKIESDIGSSDLWHLRRGERMLVKSMRHVGMRTNAIITAEIEWHAQKEDENGDSILLNETRVLTISQPETQRTVVDAKFTLAAQRDLSLNGDLQHAGVHFRASHEVQSRTSDTKYVWEPDLPGRGGKVVGKDLKWARLIFPVGENWYTATQLNLPTNPTEELSWRDYGRFGFFFKRKMEWGDELDLKYRFVIEPVAANAGGDLAAQRMAATKLYADYVQSIYEYRRQHDPDGIGKFYMGREIAHVMGHQGADWLERPERVEEEKPDALVELLELKPGMNVADIGAGTGYISWRMAQKVGAEGRVYAVDIQQEMLEMLAKQMEKRGVKNVEGVLGTIQHANLQPNSIDLVIMVDVYHEFSHPHEMMESIVSALKPGGRVALVEYRAEDPEVPIKRVHKMTEEQVKREAEAAGLVWEKTVESLPRQHLIFVKKP